MHMINTSEILETLNMIDHQKLDVRTITMGISLLGCVTDDEDRLCQNIYDLITRRAERLVEVGWAIERDYGVPIVNKRISVTPAALVTGAIRHPVKVARALDAGWGGVFYKTICLQEIKEVSPRFDAVKRVDASFAGFRNMEQLSENTVEMDFDILRRLKQNYPSKIIVASIMGQTEEQWIELAKMAEDAGVDAVELNFSCPQMRLSGMGSDVGQNTELVALYTTYVKQAVKIPVIPKMTPNVASLTQFALSAHFAGADGISAINTIKSVTMGAEVNGKRIISGYSGSAVKPIALRFILEMAGNPVLPNLQLSGIGGISTWRDALDFIQLGCQNVQVCTAVMQYGYRIIDDFIDGMRTYMASRNISRIEDMVGEELPNFVRTADLDRSTVVYPVIDRINCIGCGRCYVSCRDGGHQAITFGEDRQPHIVGTKCVGCHLCYLICPTDAIGLSKRVPKRAT